MKVRNRKRTSGKALFLRFWYILLKPVSLAIILTAIIIAFLPDYFSKYKYEIAGREIIEQHTEDVIDYFYNIDNDGFSERIRTITTAEGHMALQIYEEDHGLIDQFNMKGSILPKNVRIIPGPNDNNGYSKIFTFHRIKDTLYLDYIDPYSETDPHIIKNRKIVALSWKYNEPYPNIPDAFLADITGDSIKDLIFTINSGFAIIPHRLFCYDISRDSLYSSDNFGFSMKTGFVSDINNDLLPDIVSGSKASGNIHDSLVFRFHDYSAWIIALNNNFEFLFEPIEFPGFASCVYTYPYHKNNELNILAFANHTGPEKIKPQLWLINSTGEILKKTEVPLSGKVEAGLFKIRNNNTSVFYIITKSGHIFEVKNDLSTDKFLNLNFQCRVDLEFMHLNEDSLSEIIIKGYENDFIILNHNLKHPLHIKIPESNGKIKKFNLVKTKYNGHILKIQCENAFVDVKYESNVLYYVKYLIYLGILVALWLFILLIRKLQMIQLEKRWKVRNQITELQLKSFRSQIDPHFTFNVFNTMASLIRKESKSAYKPFIQFSNLIRNVLESSDKITRSIEEELSYLENYIALEQIRFQNKFEFIIDIDEKVDKEMLIPKMLLQTYVENAIKHGIRNKEGKGLITLSIIKEEKNIVFTVTDDGIGRKKAKEFSKDSTGFGLKIMRNYFMLFNEYNVSKIKWEINDLYDNTQNPAGTEVKIFIPLNFSYKLKKYGRLSGYNNYS